MSNYFFISYKHPFSGASRAIPKNHFDIICVDRLTHKEIKMKSECFICKKETENKIVVEAVTKELFPVCVVCGVDKSPIE